MRHPVDVRKFALAVKVTKQADQGGRVDSPVSLRGRDCFERGFSSGSISVEK